MRIEARGDTVEKLNALFELWLDSVPEDAFSCPFETQRVIELDKNREGFCGRIVLEEDNDE